MSRIPITVWLGVLALGVAATLWFRIQWVEGERDTALAERDLALAVAEANETTIATLVAEAERLDALLLRANERERAIRNQARQSRLDIEDAANENPDVEDYLREPIPDALRRLLNAPSADENGDSESGAPENDDGSL